MKQAESRKLFGTDLKVINIGLTTFYDALKDQGVKAIHVDWQPPADGDLELAEILAKLS